MAEVENQRMTQRNRFDVVSLVAGQHFEQLLVAVEGGVKVVEDLLALLFGVGARQQRRGGKSGLLHAVTGRECVHWSEMMTLLRYGQKASG
ncbi:MAG: hypothetical protein FD131_2789 [Rhodocyclaceae bacterium]|nr:MAG: hypothetical protein FD131_2789 [Rhodocyclaceae bacterium]